MLQVKSRKLKKRGSGSKLIRISYTSCNCRAAYLATTPQGQNIPCCPFLLCPLLPVFHLILKRVTAFQQNKQKKKESGCVSRFPACCLHDLLCLNGLCLGPLRIEFLAMNDLVCSDLHVILSLLFKFLDFLRCVIVPLHRYVLRFAFVELFAG